MELTTETLDQDEEEGSGDEDDEDTEEDKNEAFNDIEDEDVICSNYVSAPRTKMLPQAVVIGVRKGGTRFNQCLRLKIDFKHCFLFHRALLEFLNINSHVRRAKAEIHFYDNKFKKVAWMISPSP